MENYLQQRKIKFDIKFLFFFLWKYLLTLEIFCVNNFLCWLFNEIINKKGKEVFFNAKKSENYYDTLKIEKFWWCQNVSLKLNDKVEIFLWYVFFFFLSDGFYLKYSWIFVRSWYMGNIGLLLHNRVMKYSYLRYFMNPWSLY